MSAMPSFVCAFRGARDAYQLPLALEEGGMLTSLLTDVYATGALFKRRYAEGLPREKIKTLGAQALRERCAAWCWGSQMQWGRFDRAYARAAAEEAMRQRADLFLYHPYAYEAFRRAYAHGPRRFLFAFDPYGHVPELLEKLEACVSAVPERFREVLQPLPDWRSRDPRLEVLGEADKIFCASTFTAHTLAERGADPARVCCVPYGVEVPQEEVCLPEEHEGLRVLFVGSGVMRKGLGHLLNAWERAQLPMGSELWLVVRSAPRGLRRVVAQMPSVHWFGSVGAAELGSLYAQADLFAMPSLCEGFGQVYLEALAQGCPVLGTPFTGLPDVGGESEGVFLVEPGNVEALVHRLEALAWCLRGDLGLRQAARECARGMSWARFRQGIRAHCKNNAAHRP